MHYTNNSAHPRLQFKRIHLHYHKSVSNDGIALDASIAYHARALNIANWFLSMNSVEMLHARGTIKRRITLTNLRVPRFPVLKLHTRVVIFPIKLSYRHVVLLVPLHDIVTNVLNPRPQQAPPTSAATASRSGLPSSFPAQLSWSSFSKVPNSLVSTAAAAANFSYESHFNCEILLNIE